MQTQPFAENWLFETGEETSIEREKKLVDYPVVSPNQPASQVPAFNQATIARPAQISTLSKPPCLKVQSVKVWIVRNSCAGQKSATFDTVQICFDCRPTLDLSVAASILESKIWENDSRAEHVELLIFWKLGQAGGGGGGSWFHFSFVTGDYLCFITICFYVCICILGTLFVFIIFENFVWGSRRRFLNYSISHGPPERPFELDSVENGTRAPIPAHTYKYGRPAHTYKYGGPADTYKYGGPAHT